jgi:hypothetical protein
LESFPDAEGLVLSDESGRLVPRATGGFPLDLDELSLD